MTIDSDTDHLNLMRTMLPGFDEDTADLFAVEKNVVGPLDPGLIIARLPQCIGYCHRASQRQ